jgi:hypothetical protein
VHGSYPDSTTITGVHRYVLSSCERGVIRQPPRRDVNSTVPQPVGWTADSDLPTRTRNTTGPSPGRQRDAGSSPCLWRCRGKIQPFLECSITCWQSTRESLCRTVDDHCLFSLCLDRVQIEKDTLLKIFTTSVPCAITQEHGASGKRLRVEPHPKTRTNQVSYPVAAGGNDIHSHNSEFS